MRMVKLKDIAKELNLSVSTISRVVNNKDRVDPKTREKVLEMLKNYDYKPNEVARSLRLRDVKTIGIVIPDITNSFYASVIKGAQAVCRTNEYSMIVCNSDEDGELEEGALELLLQKQVSGLILSSVGNSFKLVQRLQGNGVPAVYIDNMPPPMHTCDSVSINNVAAAYKITNVLIEKGYKKIGIITGPIHQSTGSERLSGFKQAMANAGLELAEEWVAEGNFKIDSGLSHMRRILKMPVRPEAMVIANNYMAYGAITALREAGLKIPKDMAVVAFDAIDETGLLVPRITAINQPSYEIGRISAEIIIKKLTGSTNKKVYENIILEPELYLGSSI
ncbi:MAG TPA: LacI family transcriptional regulator [Ruminiclostridium sp.]|nr:LacI family transcriptional regulator [Ruminiclostridium sp.]